MKTRCAFCAPGADINDPWGPLAQRAEERTLIATYIAEHAVLLSGHVRKAWIQLAEEIRRGEHRAA